MHYPVQGDDSVAGYLEMTADSYSKDVERYREDIERQEKHLVELRDSRDKAILRAIECRAAANVLRATGLKTEMRGGAPYIEMPNPPKDPA